MFLLGVFTRSIKGAVRPFSVESNVQGYCGLNVLFSHQPKASATIAFLLGESSSIFDLWFCMFLPISSLTPWNVSAAVPHFSF